ncbi:MAG: glycosyltransferase family 4 protein [Pyrinomonadaceae bacterium]
MRIAVLSPSITSGDAVSNDVVGMYDALSEEKTGDVRVFAEGWTQKQLRIFPAAKIRSFLKHPHDILIYHHARGWEPGLRLLADLPCRKVIKYHNVTPPEFLAGYNQDFAAMCLEGRQQLKPIAQSRCDLYLSDSAYNMSELVAAGACQSKSFVVPPFHHIDRLDSIEPDADILRKYQDEQVNILTVGRIVPNKGHVDLLKGFASYHHDYNRHSRLFIVGKGEMRLRKYSALLHELIRRLKVEDAVSFVGEVSDNELKAFYQVADVFLTTSEHEGFCVPLVEAMAMKVPVIAYASSAIPETVGNAGVVWSERSPELLAGSIDKIVTDKSVSSALGLIGWRRYQDVFTNARIRTRFIGALEQLF